MSAAPKAMRGETLLSHWLGALGVPFTPAYTDSRFRSMPFKSLFGLKKLLSEYGVEAEGYRLPDTAALASLTPPFLAPTAEGTVIVTSIDPKDGTLGYITQGVSETIPIDRFAPVWDGTVFMAFPTADSAEPSCALHARLEWLSSAKKWVLLGAMALIFGYLYIAGGFYASAWLTAVLAVDIIGLWLSYMLVQKSLNIKSAAADRVCGVLQAGGCDDILRTSASKFFGLFGWSEVGFSYFSVSLLALLLFPSSARALAACNLLCLPFTAWSIWYQKFRAGSWCTLCVSVQASLWILAAGYLLSGATASIFPLGWDLALQMALLGLAYLGVMLGANAIDDFISRLNSKIPQQ